MAPSRPTRLSAKPRSLVVVVVVVVVSGRVEKACRLLVSLVSDHSIPLNQAQIKSSRVKVKRVHIRVSVKGLYTVDEKSGVSGVDPSSILRWTHLTLPQTRSRSFPETRFTG